MMKCLHITAKQSCLVRELLAKNLPAGSDADNLLESGAVWMGKTRCQGSEPLQSADTLRVYQRPRQSRALTLEPADVILHDARLLVVCKQPGIPVQGDPASLVNHLSHAVWLYLGAPADWRPAPITRLDQPVHGLVLFGSSAASEKALFALMRQGEIYKWYRTALSGIEVRRLTMVDLPLAHSGRMITVDPAGKRARTLFLPGRKTVEGQLFSAFPLTGRRHQIRVHASHVLGPIMGDTLYGGPVREQPGIALSCVGLNLKLGETRYRIRLPREKWSDLQ